MFEQFTQPLDNAINPQQPLDFRKELVHTSFKLRNFHTISTSTGFGRRVVVHERPQQDVAFVEDLGQKNKEINLKCFVIGDNWELERNALIDACMSGPGYLMHPEFNKLYCVCQTCHVEENKIESLKRADFDLTFVQVPDPKDYKNVYVDSAEKVRSNAKIKLTQLQQLFAASYLITNLPNMVQDFVTHNMTKLLNGFDVYQIVGAVSSFKNLLSCDFSLPANLAGNIAELTGSFNFDFTDEKGTKAITAKQAYQACITLVQNNAIYPTEYTNTIRLQNAACRQMEQFYKQSLVINAAISSTYISFTSYEDAQIVWNNVVDAFDAQILVAGNSGNNEAYRILRDAKADFISDIKLRAPGLNKIKYIKVANYTPAIVLAYSQYEDINREQEIIDRNKIINPAFVVSDALEVLVR
jgi:prophage DNA circulation protein